MKQKKMLALTPSQLKQLYRHELPELTGIAARSGDAQTFKTYLSEYMAGHPQAESEAGKLIRLLIDYDGQKVHELSTDKQLPVSTLSLLYDFLTGKLEEYLETDLFIRFIPTIQTSATPRTSPTRLPTRKAGVNGGLPDWMRMCNNSGHTTKNVSCMPSYRK